MKYGVGNRVKIREDLIEDKIYGGLYVNATMANYRGKYARVTCVNENGTYELDCDKRWWWGDEILEPAEFTKDDLRPGDILTTRDGEILNVYEDGAIEGAYGYGFRNESLNNDLTNSGMKGKALDIMKVERLQVVWTREEKTNKELHREMWNWLAENPEKQKSDWFDKEDVDALYECFACEECNSDCEKCPLDRGVIGCDRVNGLYHIWITSKNMNTRSALAKVIAWLPWKSVK